MHSSLLGARDVSVTAPGGSANLGGGFTVGQAAPTIAGVNPNQGSQGQSPVGVTITGTYLTGSSSVGFGPGITVTGFTANNSTAVSANITIGSNAAFGSRNVSVTTPGGAATLTGGFTVLPIARPAITGVNPNEGSRGQSLGVVITGTNLLGTSSASFGQGITVNSFSADNATQISANITIGSNAALCSRSVSVTTPGGSSTLGSGFLVSR